MIEVRELSKSYGAQRAVDGVSFDVQRGEVLGFLGPNGAGKSTTMRILTGYLRADSGRASIAGHDVASDSLEVRRRIGYLPESSPLYQNMGVVEYLRYVAAIRGIHGADVGTRIRRMIELCGLGEVLHKDVDELSKGFRQRVGLAATLIHDPEILILDEPTSGLDPNQIVEIRKLIKDIGREKTIILSTHILPEVEATCGRVVIINQGRAVASGTPRELAAMRRGSVLYLLTVRAPEAEARRHFERVDGVTRIETLGEQDGRVRLRIEVSPEHEDIAEQLFAVAVEESLPLSELQRQAASLEQVFTSLTSDRGAAEGEAAGGRQRPAESG